MRATMYGRVLVIDEADKAPLEVHKKKKTCTRCCCGRLVM